MIDSKIAWCHHTVNFWWGCHKVSEACRDCYAEALAKRFGMSLWGADAPRKLRVEKAIGEIDKIARIAKKTGERQRVFVNSMSDTFEDRTDLDEARGALWDCTTVDTLDFLLLTKRPWSVVKLVPKHWLDGDWPANVWIGTTVENQARANERIPYLLQVPAKVRFLSVEPMLGPVDMTQWKGQIHWVICGCESGQKRRPMETRWAGMLLNQCNEAGIPFFMKQMEIDGRVDDTGLFPQGLRVREFPKP